MTNRFGNTHLIWNAGHEARAIAALIEQERAATKAILNGLVGWVSKSAEVFRLHVDGTDGDLEVLQRSLQTTSAILFTLYDRLVEIKNRVERFRADAESYGIEIDPETYEVLRRPPAPLTAGTDPTESWRYVDPAWRALSEFEDELLRATAAAGSAWMDATYDLRALHVPFMESLVGAALGTTLLVSVITAPQSAVTAVNRSPFTRRLSEAEKKALVDAIEHEFMPTGGERRIMEALATDIQQFGKLADRALAGSGLPAGGAELASKVLRSTHWRLVRRLPVIGAAGATVGFAAEVEEYGAKKSLIGNIGGFGAGELAGYGAGGAAAALGGSAVAVVGATAAAGYVVGTGVHSWATRGDASEFLDHYLTVDHALKESDRK